MVENFYQPPMRSSSEPEGDGLLRRPLVATLLSLVVPGAGQLYNGRYLLGLAFFLTVNSLWFVIQAGFLARHAWDFFALAGVCVILVLASIIEAAVRAYRRSHIPPRLFHRWFVFLPVVALLATIPFLVPEIASPTRPTLVPFGSMQRTIQPGEVALVDHRYYRHHPPCRGDIAVLLSPHDEAKLFRRVIALPGERVEMRDGRAIIDGDPTLDRWAHLEGEPLSLPFVGTVPPGELFVLGDNRHNSRDSRSFGFVTEDRLLGRAESIYFSEDLDRIGLRLHK